PRRSSDLSALRTLAFWPLNDGQPSKLTLPTSTVIHVDSLAVYAAAYPDETQTDSYDPGQTVWIRAQVSDPFGYEDITGGSLVIKAPSGVTLSTTEVT